MKYTVYGFIDKNKDLLYQDYKRLMFNSKNETIKSMWPEGKDDITKVTKKPPTVSSLFKNSMITLVQNLSSKDPFYVIL